MSSGIAIAGIWIGVGISSLGEGGHYIVITAMFACLAILFANIQK